MDETEPNAGDDATPPKEAMIEAFLGGDARQRRAVLKDLREHLERDDVARIAPVIRDPSPKISARVTSLMARHGLDELFEKLLIGLKPGKAELLRRQYRKIAGSTESTPDE